MSYRVRLMSVPYSASYVRALSPADVIALCNEYSCYPYRPHFATELYELPVIPSGDIGTPFYKPGVVDNESLFNIISKQEFSDYIDFVADLLNEGFNEEYERAHAVFEKIANNEALTDVDRFVLKEVESTMYSRSSRWVKLRFDKRVITAYSLTSEAEPVKSYSTEYQFFNLLHTFYNFDWGNNMMVISGW